VTRFNDAGARQAFRHLVPLRGLVPKIAARRAASKERLPWLKLATFGDQPSPKGSLRHNGNVLAVDGIEGDHDDGSVTPEVAAQKLQQAGVAALIYTSPSHTPERPRWRVLAPLSRSMPPEERERFCARLQGVLGGSLAPESFALSQSYYYGGIQGAAPPETLLIEGVGIDTLERLDAGALDKRGKPFTRLDPDDFMYVPPGLLEPSSEAEDDDPFAGVVHNRNIEKIRGALDTIPAELRDDREGCWRPVGMALHHEFEGDESGFKLWDEWSADSGKYNARDQRRVWESFGKSTGKATKIATLYALAKEHGWNGKAPAAREPSRLRFYTPDQCQSAQRRPYVIKGLLREGNVACIFGPPGVGKSALGPYLGYRVARGELAFGLKTKPGPVLYVAAEDCHGMMERVTALRIRLGHTPDFHVVDGVTDLLADDSADLAELRAAVERIQPKLIVIDTLAMAFRDLEENDNQGMTRVVRAARSLTSRDAAVVLIHHGTKADGSTPRGHSSLNGALDTSLELKKSDDSIIRGRLDKNRNGSPDLDIAFRIVAENLGVDEDGDPITAATVEEMAAGSAPRRVKLPDSQAAALAILHDMETAGPVSEESWRTACLAGRTVSGAEKEDSRRKAFDRAYADLSRKQRVAVLPDGMVQSRRPSLEIVGSWDDDE
jgi:archaellum biogenesis ATPase FlaH